MKIICDYEPWAAIHPPSMPWIVPTPYYAYDEDAYDPEGPNTVGWGTTEEAAIADLLEQIEEEQP